MISGISKKVIFPYFLFINFIQPVKSEQFQEIYKIDSNLTNQSSWLHKKTKNISSNSSKQSFNNSEELSDNKIFLEKNSDLLSPDINEKQEIGFTADRPLVLLRTKASLKFIPRVILDAG